MNTKRDIKPDEREILDAVFPLEGEYAEFPSETKILQFPRNFRVQLEFNKDGTAKSLGFYIGEEAVVLEGGDVVIIYNHLNDCRVPLT